MPTYRKHSWLDPRVAIAPSPHGGRGTFAAAPFAAGEVVTIWGGALFSRADVEAGRCEPGTIAAIDEDRYLAAPAGAPETSDRYLNHSCDSNLWLADEVTLVTRRAIPAGEELTLDYALFEGHEETIMEWQCRCGVDTCRSQVTGKDWRREDLRERYAGHFSPFLQRRIAALSAEETL